MTVTLAAPISETDYKSYPSVLALPSDLTGDPVTTLLNQAWRLITSWANQPLSSTSTTDIYDVPGKYANMTPSRIFVVTSKYVPVISVTSVKWSQNINQDGWTASSNYDTVNNYINVYDCPFDRGDYGMIQLVYTSGYATVPDDLKLCCALVASRLLAAGFFPTQQGSSVTPEWLMGADSKIYYQVRQILEFYKRRR